MYTLSQLAELIHGQLSGDGQLEIHGADTLGASQPRQITFLRDHRRLGLLESTRASAVIIPRDMTCALPSISVDDPEAAFTQIVALFRPRFERPFQGISPLANISPTAELGENVTIYPGAFIGDDVCVGDHTVIHANAVILEESHIGHHVQIFPGAVIYERSKIGNRAMIHANAVIGAYGFGYDTQGGRHVLSPQLGSVVIDDDCEIGAGTTIDRGTYGDTRIGQGTKIDNQVMIGHNCQIGKHNLLVSQVGIAGSCHTGDFVVMAGQVGIGDHIRIGEQTVLTAKAGIINDVPAGQTYAGIPATPIKEQMQMLACQAKLPEMRKDLKHVKRQLAESPSATAPERAA